MAIELPVRDFFALFGKLLIIVLFFIFLVFIAEGGVKCLEERKKAVEGCVNKTVEGKVPTSLNINTIPLLIFGAEECQ